MTLSAAPARSEGKWVETGNTAAAASNTTAQPEAQASPEARKSLKKRVKAVLQKVNPLRLVRDRQYKKAAALFPSFCKDWERKLHDRQANNQSHIAWQQKDGWETGSYVGYGPVKKCECHQSSDGYSIGKVTYEEFDYYIAGKTPDEAKRAEPKVSAITATTELFRWDKDKWFY